MKCPWEISSWRSLSYSSPHWFSCLHSPLGLIMYSHTVMYHFVFFSCNTNIVFSLNFQLLKPGYWSIKTFLEVDVWNSVSVPLISKWINSQYFINPQKDEFKLTPLATRKTFKVNDFRRIAMLVFPCLHVCVPALNFLAQFDKR